MDLITVTYGAGTELLYSELVVDFAASELPDDMDGVPDPNQIIDALIAFNRTDAVRAYGHVAMHGNSLSVGIADGGVITEKGPGWVRLPEQMRTDLLAAAQRAYDSDSIVD